MKLSTAFTLLYSYDRVFRDHQGNCGEYVTRLRTLRTSSARSIWLLVGSHCRVCVNAPTGASIAFSVGCVARAPTLSSVVRRNFKEKCEP
jgi:hypothetical protein